MVVKTLIKQSFVSIKQTFNRFISILVIVLLGVGFFTGIRETSPNMKDSLDAYFKKENVYDISIMSTIDQKAISQCPIPVPSLSEQVHIVETIKTFDAYIDDLAELIEKKRGIRDGALENLIVGRTRIAGFYGEWKEYAISDRGLYLSDGVRA